MYHQRFKTIEQRWAEKYAVTPSGCWQWKTGTGSFSYPKFWDGRRHVRASHFSWERANGRPLTTTEQVLHHCDNPRCVNPDHLFVGDYVANMQDRKMKGRGNHSTGERNGRASITKAVAAEIRRRYAEGKISQQALADTFGLGQSTVSSIIRREIWKEDL